MTTTNTHSTTHNTTTHPLDTKTQYAPVIGVLTQPIPNESGTFVPASYIKFIELGGGRVIPIRYDINRNELDDLTNKLNGILLPGGSTQLQIKDRDKNIRMVGLTEYAQTIEFLVKKSMKLYDQGEILPIFGICLGMQSIILTLNPSRNILKRIETNYALGPIGKFQSIITKSRLFANLPHELHKAVENEDILHYHHRFAIKKKHFHKSDILKRLIRPLSYHQDIKGTVFVSSYEGINYPFYGLQFHPEKHQFEWKIQTNRTPKALDFASHLSKKFIDHCRKSKSYFPEEDFQRLSVYNFPVRNNYQAFSQTFIV